MYIKILKKKYQKKWENAYLIVKNCKTFQGPKAGPGSWPILACFAHPTPLYYISKISEKFLAPPFDQMLDP